MEEILDRLEDLIAQIRKYHKEDNYLQYEKIEALVAETENLNEMYGHN